MLGYSIDRVGSLLFPRIFLVITALSISSLALANSNTAHAIALHGEPKYPAEFEHFDYVNPHAPKGGSVRLMAQGTFDTLNPYTLKGISPIGTPGFYLYGFSELNEPLFVGSGSYAPSGDEAQTAYGLIAESIEYPPDRSWAIFTIRPTARFHDGSKITADDVVFSFNTLIEDGHPRFAQNYTDVDSVTALDRQRVKFTFKGLDNRAMPLRAGELPVLSKAFWEGRDFTKSILEPPLGSGPYQISDFEPGRFITFSRVKDYWGKDLAVNVGRYNFDEVRYDFYRDRIVSFEGFKSYEFDMYLDYTARNWATGYQFPAVKSGRVVKTEITHREATGYQAYFLNTRRGIFKDRRVRHALNLLFNYEWLNKAIFFSAYKRNDTFFPNTELAATGLPSDAELKYLEPFRTELPAEVFTQAYQSPRNTSNRDVRANRRKALQLLSDAGWEVKDTRLINRETGEHFRFEVLIDEQRMSRVVAPLQQDLKRAGIELNLRVVDPTQYKNRLDNFDYDATIIVLPTSLSPGHELKGYFGSENVDVPGVRNYSGVRNTVVDELIKAIIAAEDRTELVAASRALDRVLLWNYYTIPQWHNDHHRAAFWNKFSRPKVSSPYAFNFRDWWLDEEKFKALSENQSQNIKEQE